jgi:hypothetical protein
LGEEDITVEEVEVAAETSGEEGAEAEKSGSCVVNSDRIEKGSKLQYGEVDGTE